MDEYKKVELADIHIVHGKVHCNGRAASRLCAERHQIRCVLNYQLFAILHSKLRMEHSEEEGMM